MASAREVAVGGETNGAEDDEALSDDSSGSCGRAGAVRTREVGAM